MSNPTFVELCRLFLGCLAALLWLSCGFDNFFKDILPPSYPNTKLVYSIYFGVQAGKFCSKKFVHIGLFISSRILDNHPWENLSLDNHPMDYHTLLQSGLYKRE